MALQISCGTVGAWTTCQWLAVVTVGAMQVNRPQAHCAKQTATDCVWHSKKPTATRPCHLSLACYLLTTMSQLLQIFPTCKSCDMGGYQPHPLWVHPPSLSDPWSPTPSLSVPCATDSHRAPLRTSSRLLLGGGAPAAYSDHCPCSS